jgi:exodeoxyribonuclease V beta subunit
MTTVTNWSGTEALPPGQTILLEASAGTGKTWQIEGLVTRLVAEYGVTIDRILVITFTNAATAELRDRIRKRLVAARDALAPTAAVSDDPIIAQLQADTSTRGERRTLLAAAVSTFDLAAISTIHGFSQRTLDQLAFESGQEPGLELLADSSTVSGQLVDDALANVYAEATGEELVVLADMGWTRGALAQLTGTMTKAVEPVLEPAAAPGQATPIEPLDVARQWLRQKEELRAWLDSPACLSSVAAVSGELDLKKAKRLSKMRRDVVGKNLDSVKEWLDGPALRPNPNGKTPLNTALRNLQLPALEAAWTEDSTSMRAFGGFPLFEAVSALMDVQNELWPQALLGFAAGVRARMDAELTRGGHLTYSTMLSRLAERIASQGTNGPLAQAIRGRYDVALVDEFQDTDGAQWPVIRTVFAHPERRLLIIGDPKQAIYAFRGADVHVYLDAAKRADTRATMGRNWRSDGDYIHGMNHLWSAGSGGFGLDEVDYVEVDFPSKNGASRIRNLPAQGQRPRRAFELRWTDGTTLGADERPVGSKSDGEDATAHLAALEAARLLEGGCEIVDEQSETLAWRALRPGDIAVLVRTNGQAERTRQHLERLGIPSVSAGRGSVMSSPVVDWLSAWLDAVSEPGRDRPARALATTPLFRWTARDLATAVAAADAGSKAPLSQEQTDAAKRWDYWLRSVQSWARLWPSRGFARVFETALDDFDVLEGLLGAEQGERYATDLRHLIELCHSQERRTRVGPAGLASWLRATRDSGGGGADDANALRLESDARAVQLITIHKSKGLEYPVVLLPFCWAEFQSKDSGGALEWHAPTPAGSELRLNLEPLGTENRTHAAECAAEESQQEQSRLLYVALTRARHHCVAWLGPFGSAGRKQGSYALGRMSLRKRDESGVPKTNGDCPAFEAASRSKSPAVLAALDATQSAVWTDIERRFEHLAETSNGTIGWAIEPKIQPRDAVVLDVGPAQTIRARTWAAKRTLEGNWRVSSYSAMVAGRTFDASEPQRLGEVGARTQPMIGDEAGAQVELGEPTQTAALDTPIASVTLRGGTEVGTWAHAVLETLDFQRCDASDGRTLPTLIAELGDRHGVRVAEDHAQLAAMLPKVLSTPLDGGRSDLPKGFSLGALPRADRLDELAFDLSIGKGADRRGEVEREGGQLNAAAARLALASRLGESDWGGEAWLRALLDRSAEEGTAVLPQMTGILTGFVDLTFRVEGHGNADNADHRYFVADYKTNWIAPSHQRRDARTVHYTKPWLAWEMAHHGYHLQALLYTVALHRMLRQRLVDYSYDRHIGGYLYLFLRGMSGEETPRVEGLAPGVYFDRWPSSVVLGLDAALAGESTESVRQLIDDLQADGGAS